MNSRTASPASALAARASPPTVPGRGAVQDQEDFANQCGPGGGLNLAPRDPEGPGSESVAQARGRASATPAADPDSRVQIVSPLDGQIFAPGDVVPIVVRLTPPLVANDIGVIIPGFDRLEGTNYNGVQYEASFAIPAFFAGPLTLIPDITDTNDEPISGVSIIIGSVPAPPPLAVALQQRNFRISLPPRTPPSPSPSKARIRGRSRTTSPRPSPARRTRPRTPTWSRSDREGVYQIVGAGFAVIKASNSGLTDFAVFVVDDRNNPLPPMDVMSQFSIRPGGFRLDRSSGFFVQDVVIASLQEVPVPGPLYLLVEGLPAGINLVNQSGTTQTIQPGRALLDAALELGRAQRAPGREPDPDPSVPEPCPDDISYSPTIHWTSGAP